MAKNIWSKTRPVTDPYLTVQFDDWTWKVLKAYKSRKGEITDQYARWLCCVITPLTGSRGDLGDVYVREIPITTEAIEILIERQKQEETA